MFRLLFGLFRHFFSSRRDLLLENLALRQQLLALQRRKAKNPDLLTLIGCSGLLSGGCGRNGNKPCQKTDATTNLNLQRFVLRTKGMHAKLTSRCDSACKTHIPRGGTGLFPRAEKIVISGVRLELGLAHRAGGGGSSSSFGVQSLDESDIGKELAARGPLLISD